MKLIKKSVDGHDLSDYVAYLDARRAAFPANALAFAAASWHYDPTQRECPHDSWLQSLVIKEPAEGTRQEIRDVEIVATLLGAYHDGLIELTYKHVQAYSLAYARSAGSGAAAERARTRGHGDWIIDEVLLTDDGFVPPRSNSTDRADRTSDARTSFIVGVPNDRSIVGAGADGPLPASQAASRRAPAKSTLTPIPPRISKGGKSRQLA